MKNIKNYTNHDIIEKTRQFIHSFYNRQMDRVTDEMSEDFLWIGSYDFQWTKGKEEFRKITYSESQEAPVRLSQEEYHVLSQERSIWIVYGRYTADALLPDGTLLHAKVRGTFIWKQWDNQLKIIHVHGSNAQDVPLALNEDSWKSYDGKIGFFHYLKSIDPLSVTREKLQFRDRMNSYHFLLPSEILYLKADRQWCTVFTKDLSFEVRGGISHYQELLPDHFIRIHKSYLVNKSHIVTVHRYGASLRDGTELPIGKERYRMINDILMNKIVESSRG